jgi:hypothetical protein
LKPTVWSLCPDPATVLKPLSPKTANCLGSSYKIHEISLRIATDHCWTVFNISDIIRVHPAPPFLLPFMLQIHICHNKIIFTSGAHDYNWGPPPNHPKKRSLPSCSLSYSISHRCSGNETVAHTNVLSRDNHHHVT